MRHALAASTRDEDPTLSKIHPLLPSVVEEGGLEVIDPDSLVDGSGELVYEPLRGTQPGVLLNPKTTALSTKQAAVSNSSSASAAISFSEDDYDDSGASVASGDVVPPPPSSAPILETRSSEDDDFSDFSPDSISDF